MSTKKEFRALNISSCKIDRREDDKDKALIISGVANSGQTDRCLEVMPEECWQLDNFNLNPIMLYNHDHSKPIGRVIKLLPTEKGLEFVAEIGVGSDFGLTATQKEVRALIAQGILNTLSVGFIAHDWAWEGKDGRDVMVYKSAELTEISVVTVPMDALASITGVSVKQLLGKGNSKTQKKGGDSMSVEYKDVKQLLDEAVKSISEEMSKSFTELKEKAAEAETVKKEAEEEVSNISEKLKEVKEEAAKAAESLKEHQEYIKELEDALKQLSEEEVTEEGEGE